MRTDIKVKLLKSCTKCRLCKTRKQVVIGSGNATKQSKILFVGEAPGKTEDLMGEAFIGPSGKLLRTMLDRASDMANRMLPDYYITNVVLCRPTDSKLGPNRPPEFDEILACGSNFLSIVDAIQPEVVVFIGKVAEKYYKDEFPGSISIQHPSFLLRTGGKASPFYMQNVRTLAGIL